MGDDFSICEASQRYATVVASGNHEDIVRRLRKQRDAVSYFRQYQCLFGRRRQAVVNGDIHAAQRRKFDVVANAPIEHRILLCNISCNGIRACRWLQDSDVLAICEDDFKLTICVQTISTRAEYTIGPESGQGIRPATTSCLSGRFRTCAAVMRCGSMLVIKARSESSVPLPSNVHKNRASGSPPDCGYSAPETTTTSE